MLATDSDPAIYVAAAVLTLYVDLPDTPLRANVQDQRQARRLYDRGVPLRVVEAAFLLASLRRLARPSDVPPCHRFDRWPTSSLSSTNCWSIPRPTVISNTCASSSATG